MESGMERSEDRSVGGDSDGFGAPAICVNRDREES